MLRDRTAPVTADSDSRATTSGLTIRTDAFRPDVQGLRAIAVLLVVVFHSGLPVPGGFVGVDVFFVISGFVISLLLSRELDATGGINFRAFYARRVRRLLPALAIVSFVTLGLSFLVLSPLGSQQIASTTAAASALFAANFALFLQPTGYFAAPAQLNPFLHTWSLAVEEQFYVIFPLLLVLGWRLARRLQPFRPAPRVAPIGLLVALCAISFGLSIFFSYAQGAPFQSRNAAFAFYSSPTRAWEFGLGALVALASVPLTRLPRSLAVVAGISGAVVVAASALVLDESVPYPGIAALLPTTGTMLTIAAGTISLNQPVGRVLAARPLRWIGDQSYGWYLWHWPMLVFASVLAPPDVAVFVIAATGFLSLLPAWASKRLVEDPIRFATRGFSPALTASVSVGVPLIVAAALLTVSTIANPVITDIREQRRNHLDVTAGCTRNLPDDPRTSAQCTWPRDASLDNRAIVLIGDSNAGQFAEPIVEIAESQGMSAVLATKSGCPFADIEMQPEPSGCHTFVAAWVRALVEARPALVIIASAGTNYVTYETDIAIGATSSALSTSEAAKARAWENGTRAVVEPLARAGIRVLLINTLPHFVDWNIYRCPAVTLYSDPLSCGRVSKRADLESDRAPSLEAERNALRGLPGATMIDLSAQICGTSTCFTNDGSRWVNIDDSHITVGEAQRLKPHLSEAISSALGDR